MTLDNICQLLIPLLWLPAHFLTSNLQRRVGFWLGLAAFPPYFYSAYTHQQWGFLAVDVVALFIWGNGLRRAYYVEPDRWR